MALLPVRPRRHPCQRGSLHEKIFDDLWHQPALLRLLGLAHDGREVQLPRGQSFQGRRGNPLQPRGIHFLDNPLFDHILCQVAGIHVAQHALQLIGRKHIAQHIEDLAGAFGVEIRLDLLDTFKQFLEHATLTGVGADEVHDEAVFLLAVPMDATHALFKAVGVPGDIVVNHVPAELQIDALTSRLGGHQHLAVLPELALRVDAGARGVPIADLHAAMNLGDVETPFA